ncbi:MAG: hypothetical protein KKE44_17690 [Proteobacteria bacterium]|nr:hypothetical protein [Pseudomonadota bacterium]MBU1584566.1 hypothetical protein [Pseudomonadota bacterium]MBU2455532.1 hypothetical protein [Pseudomonadota bacterium]MBU2627679.1 hypothetical protein [Pseudomonadota bacterium]
MLKIQHISQIVLGPRQLTFGFDKNPQQEQDLVVSCITHQFETHGHVELDKIIPHVNELHDLTETDTLQYIFWSAQELKIHFRVDGKNITPFQAKQLLLESPEEPMSLVTNKHVEEPIFKDVASFYQNLSNSKKHLDFDDQYAVSCSLLTDLKNWEDRLGSFKPIAQKPFYPGGQKIEEHLQSLKKILRKQDTYSLIYACYHHKEKISQMAEDVNIISSFYNNHVTFWDILIQSIEDFRVNLTQLKKNPEAFSKFNRLLQIISSKDPYHFIAEASDLLKTVQHHNDIIVQKSIEAHRVTSASKIDSMIENLVDLFDSYTPDQDLRNKSLYALRQVKKKLALAKNIQQLDQLLCNTEDMVDDFVEELKER